MSDDSRSEESSESDEGRWHKSRSWGSSLSDYVGEDNDDGDYNDDDNDDGDDPHAASFKWANREAEKHEQQEMLQRGPLPEDEDHMTKLLNDEEALRQRRRIRRVNERQEQAATANAEFEDRASPNVQWQGRPPATQRPAPATQQTGSNVEVDFDQEVRSPPAKRQHLQHKEAEATTWTAAGGGGSNDIGLGEFSAAVNAVGMLSPRSPNLEPCTDAQGRTRSEDRLKKNGNWTSQQLRSAIADVDDGDTIRSAARDHGIPCSSLRGHVYGTTMQRRRGRKGVLTDAEEEKLVQYLLRMQELGFPLTLGQLREKVGILTQGRVTPFTDGVPGAGWVKCFRRRHPELTLRKPQALDQKRARSLCPLTVGSFYSNLQHLYDIHNYSPDHIWNCDESGAQAGKDGGGYVIAKKGSRAVHMVTPDQREWLSVLSCINASGDFLPNFYIFKGKRRTRNFLKKTGEAGAVFAMQPKAWMTHYLFRAWMTHFLERVDVLYGISPTNRHLLILDGHGSHVTLDVIKLAKSKGLDLLTLPSHTSHAMQPLDVSCFRPFKVAFRAYRDKWTLSHKGKSPMKEELAAWVAHALKRALTCHNIIKGFKTTGIYPINPTAMDAKMGPSSAYVSSAATAVTGQTENEGLQSQEPYELDQWEIEEILGEMPSDLPNCQQYYVDIDGGKEQDLEEDNSSGEDDAAEDDAEEERSSDVQQSFTALLALPTIQLPPKSKRVSEPRVDYSNSIILTEEQHVQQLEEVAARKEEAAKEKKRRLSEKEGMKAMKAQEKRKKQEAKQVKAALALSKKRHKEYWSLDNVQAMGDRLHAVIRQNAAGNGNVAPYSGAFLAVCKRNQRVALERRRAKKGGLNRSHLPALEEVPSRAWSFTPSHQSLYASSSAFHFSHIRYASPTPLYPSFSQAGSSAAAATFTIQ